MAKKKPTKPKKKKSLLRFCLKWSFVLGLWSFMILGAVVAWYAGELPAITQDVSFARKSAIIIKASDGSIIARYGDIKGNNVTAQDLPDHLIYAVLATEDRRFYSHPGIDPVGLARAMATNLSRGRLVQGGSTITQQLAKNLFLSQERTIKRKIQEAILAIWLERELTKDEILSAYLNRVYLGAGTYGVDAAARLYFSKPAKDVTLYEGAMLAGLLKAPSRYSPKRNPDLAHQRTKTVLQNMVNAGYLTQSKIKNLNSTVIDIATTQDRGDMARYFTDWVVDSIDEIIGTPSEDLIIETTLAPGIQDIAQQALIGTIEQHGETAHMSQGAVIVMLPDGAILSMVGGENYRKSQFNRAVQARRQPGSAFKPILYLSALESGLSADDKILDAPLEDSAYQPKNFNDEYYGEVTLQQALAKSMNTASVRLMQKVGISNFQKTARKLGIFSPLTKDLSLALGSSEMSLLELTTAYSVMANNGYGTYPYAITKITNMDGELYYIRSKTQETRHVIETRHAREISDMLEDVVETGTGKAARISGQSIAGKTGTSQDYRDAWFVGYNDDLIAGVWLGNDDNSPMNGITGGRYPTQIWKTVITAAEGKYDHIDQSHYKGSGFGGLISRLLSSGDEQPRSYND